MSPLCTAHLVCPVCKGFLNVVCPVPKGFSTSCDHLTVCCPGSAPGTHLFGSLVWKTPVCVCVCACPEAHPASVCVQTFVLYCCSLGGGDKPSWRRPFLRSPHSNRVSVMSFPCHPHHAMRLPNSSPVVVSPRCKERLAGEVLSVWCARSPEPLLPPPRAVVWALCIKTGPF